MLYAWPSLFFLSIAFLLFYNLYTNPKGISNWYKFKFWWMVFSVLYVTAIVTMAPLAYTLCDGPFYTGFAVVARWRNAGLNSLFISSGISVSLNIVAGFVAAPLLMRFSPSRSLVATRQGKKIIITRYFLLSLLAVLPVAILLAYPGGVVFFVIVLVHAILWLPGLFMIKGNSIITRQYCSSSHDVYQYEKINNRLVNQVFDVKLPLLLIALIVLIRVFM